MDAVLWVTTRVVSFWQHVLLSALILGGLGLSITRKVGRGLDVALNGSLRNEAGAIGPGWRVLGRMLRIVGRRDPRHVL